jgi:hypothetical protein
MENNVPFIITSLVSNGSNSPAEISPIKNTVLLKFVGEVGSIIELKNPDIPKICPVRSIKREDEAPIRNPPIKLLLIILVKPLYGFSAGVLSFGSRNRMI